MADNKSLLITINADAKNVVKAYEDIRDKTEDLEKELGKVALVSAAAFAAFTAEIYLSTRAFEEASVSAVKLTNALQNQGIYTKELADEYDRYATTIQKATGYDDDAVKSSLAVAQSYLGQTKITEELAFAITDLGAKMGGDLDGAAQKIAVTIGTSTNAFKKQGLEISETATEAERYAKVLEFVQIKAGGLAEEFNKADGYSKALTNAFGNLQEAIGSRFSPIIAAARKYLVSFFQAISENKEWTDFISSVIVAGTVVTGLIAALTAALPAILAIKAAAAALGVGLSAAFVGIPLLIGAVVSALAILAFNWEKTLALISFYSSQFFTLISESFSGLGKVIAGALTLDVNKIKTGLAQIADASNKANADALAAYKYQTEATKEEIKKQDEAKQDQANKEAQREREHQAVLVAIRKASIDLLRLQNQNASQELIDLKSKEIEILKALEQEKTATEEALLRERLAKNKQLQAEAQEEEIERRAEFDQIVLQSRAELAAQGIDADVELSDKKIAELRAATKTEDDINKEFLAEKITSNTEARRQEIADTQKYGETYAKINKAINSDEVKGAQKAGDELVALQNSKNETLKTIGKAAAITDITISTAKSAMKIYEGFSAIPIIGPALGVAGAAAAVAFGAERIGQVTAAAQGGLITGGIAGRDSVPALLTPGELVVPEKNFDQVVGAVQGDGKSSTSPEMISLLQSIDSKLSQPTVTNINGDILAEDSFIDRLVRQISDAVEFRNGKIAGVNI